MLERGALTRVRGALHGSPVVTRAWRRLLAFVPTRRAAARPVRARARRVLDPRARVADGEGARHVGLPRVLPPALRLRAAARRAPALPHAAHAARRRAPARPRRQLSLLEVVFGAPVRGLDPRLERDGAHLRAHSGAASARSSCSSIPRTRRCTTRPRATPCSRPGSRSGRSSSRVRSDARRPGASPRSGPGSPCSCSFGPRTRCCCRAVARAAPRARRLAPAPRLAAACLAAAVLPLAAWAVHNGVRYDDATVARGGRAWVPFLQRLARQQDDLARERRRLRAARGLIESEVLAEDPHARLDVTLDAYLANGTNYETVRLIALSDEVLGRGENYDVMFDSALEAIRERPGDVPPRRRRHVLGVPRSSSRCARTSRRASRRRPRLPRRPSRPTASCSRTRRRTSSSTASRTASSGARPTTSTPARSPTRR